MRRNMDVDKIIMAFFSIAMAFVALIIVFSIISTVRKATSEKEMVQEIHVIAEKDKRIQNRVVSSGKTTRVHSDTHYYLITDEGVELKVSYGAYKKYAIGDSIVITHTYYLNNNGECFDEDYNITE